MFWEIYTSIRDDIKRTPKIKSENIVCLITSIFIFSFLLSCMIDLYNFIPLTAKATVQGIAIKFFKSSVESINIMDLPNAKELIIEAILKPK